MAAPYPNNCQILGLKPMTSVRRSDPCPLRRQRRSSAYAWSCRLAASALVPRLRSCLSLAPFLAVSRYLAVSSVVSRFQPSDRRTGEPTCAGGETRYLAKYLALAVRNQIFIYPSGGTIWHSRNHAKYFQTLALPHSHFTSLGYHGVFEVHVAWICVT